MPKQPNYSEPDTRAKLIDPALRKQGWTEDHIRREENAGSLYKYRGRWRRDQKFADYLLRIPIGNNPEPVAIAVIEAKRNRKPVAEGFPQAKEYASAKRLNVPFTFASNGYRFIEYDKITGHISPPRPMAQFPTPADLRARYEQHLGINLEDDIAKPLHTPYTGGDSVRRYYQDAAIRAVLEAIAQGRKRMLVAMALPQPSVAWHLY